MAKARCYVLKPESCEAEVWGRVVEGTARVVDYFAVEDGDGQDGEGRREGEGGIWGDDL
jgi:hypothetical protein